MSDSKMRIKSIIRKIKALKFATTAKQSVCRPIFIIGCGRSGTTILGRSLSMHPRVTYLNEPRNIWFSAYPKADIWSAKSSEREGKLHLTEYDVNRASTKKLKNLFYRQILKTGRPVLVEKLPINSFRLRFIHKMFPNAKYIYIYRNAIEVAKSIEKICEHLPWYGKEDYKWKELIAFAQKNQNTSHLPGECMDNYERGLLEWRLSTFEVKQFLSRLAKNQYMTTSYDEFLNTPVLTINAVRSFIGLKESQELDTFVKENVKRSSKKEGYSKLSSREKHICGDLLMQQNITTG